MYTKDFDIPVVFHDLSSHNAHLIILKINDLIRRPLGVMPLNDGCVINLRFMNSLCLIPSPLGTLASYLKFDQLVALKSGMANIDDY